MSNAQQGGFLPPEPSQFPQQPQPQQFPQQSWGGGPRQQVPRQNRKLLLGIGALVLALIVGVAIGAFLLLRNASDNDRIDHAIRDYYKTMGDNSIDASIKYSCATQKSWWGGLPQPARVLAERNRIQLTITAIRDIQVDGDSATAMVRSHSQRNSTEREARVPLQREDGDWKVCTRPPSS